MRRGSVHDPGGLTTAFPTYQTRTYFSICQRLCLGDGYRSAHRDNRATADASLQREVRGLDDLNENHIPPALAEDPSARSKTVHQVKSNVQLTPKTPSFPSPAQVLLTERLHLPIRDPGLKRPQLQLPEAHARCEASHHDLGRLGSRDLTREHVDACTSSQRTLEPAVSRVVCWNYNLGATASSDIATLGEDIASITEAAALEPVVEPRGRSHRLHCCIRTV